MNYTKEELKKIALEEYAKCASDLIYFAKKYVYIKHPTRGRILFNLYPFQEQVIRDLYVHDKSIILKARQLGISTLLSAYAVWLMTFKEDQNIVVLASKLKVAQEIMDKVKVMYYSLPTFLRGTNPPDKDNTQTLQIKNGSKISAFSANSDEGRSQAASVVIIDEFAFIQRSEDLWTSVFPTISTGGKAILLSTPNSSGGTFHRLWMQAEMGENDFYPIKLKWDVHPERDQKWRNDQEKVLGKRKAEQENDCDFLASGDTVFDTETIIHYNNGIIEPIEKRGQMRDYWIWKYPIFGKNYSIIVDTSRGDSVDYSSISVYDSEEMELVAEFKGNLDTPVLGTLAVAIATEYNQGLLIIENTGIGWATVQKVEEIGYLNTYKSLKNSTNLSVEQYMAKQMNNDNYVNGFSNNVGTRPLIINKLIEYISNRLIKNPSKRFHDELKSFIWNNGKATASDGCNDDLIIPCAIFCYLRENFLTYNKSAENLYRASVSAIKSGRDYYNIMPEGEFFNKHMLQTVQQNNILPDYRKIDDSMYSGKANDAFRQWNMKYGNEFINFNWLVENNT